MTTIEAYRPPPGVESTRISPSNLEKLGLSQYRLANGISVPPRRINEIVHRKRSITADSALRLGRFFGTTEAFWLNLQGHYDLEIERDRLGPALEEQVEVPAR